MDSKHRGSPKSNQTPAECMSGWMEPKGNELKNEVSSTNPVEHLEG